MIKRAQVSDLMSWMITTLVVIVLIFILIFFVNFSFLNDAKVERYNSIRTSDFVVGESLLAYSITQEPSGSVFYYDIKSAGNLDEQKDNGKFAGLIFKNLYPEYSDAWLGVSYFEEKLFGKVINGKSINPFDTNRPFEGRVHSEVGFGDREYKFANVKINFEKEKFLEFLGRVQ